MENNIKQETLQEVAKRYANNEIKDRGNDNDKLICSIDFIEGAKWNEEQNKNKYSDEDMKLSFDAGLRKAHSSKKHSECWKEWFEQYKKK